MKTKTLKQILATTALATTLLLTNAGISNAALQANSNTQYTKEAKPTEWISLIRKMELEGGAMGLSEIQNTDLTPSNGSSNGIDVHMMRTTEYGAIAILSASGYGNPSNAKEITTTTGNNTGVILNAANSEWTAGGLSGSIFSGINSRYFDTYSAATTEIPYPGRIGDALGNGTTSPNKGAQGWHSASSSNWVNSSYPYFGHGYGGIFSFYSGSGNSTPYCRGVAVCSAGL